MKVSFHFLGQNNVVQYTSVSLPGSQQLGSQPSSEPYLFGRLVPKQDSEARDVQLVLLGVSGRGKATVSMEVVTPLQASDSATALSFELGFPRFGQLGDNPSVPGISYGEVRKVTIWRPDWVKDIQIKDQSKVRRETGSVVIDITDNSFLAFDIVPHVGGWIKFVTAVAIGNFMYLLLPLFFGSIVSFLVPARVHKTIRISLALAAVGLAVWLVRASSPFPALPVFAKDLAPLIAAEIGLILCVISFDRLEELLKRFGARS